MSELHHVYLIPGMFGFGRLAGVDYFHHVRRALTERFAVHGVRLVIEVVPTPPTSSLRHRAKILSQTVVHTLRDETGPIHLLGHSTGGLDARLVLSPSTSLGNPRSELAWTNRVRTAVSINTPHYGTPLAGYFATVAGTRMLYAISLLTVITLSVGEPSLAVFSKLLAGLGGVDTLLGDDARLVSRVTDMFLRVLDQRGRTEVLRYLHNVRIDQGGIIQIMPEAIDLLNAAAENHPAVRYGCVISSAPAPTEMRFIKRLISPFAATTAAIYSTIYHVTAKSSKVYPYAIPSAEQTDQFRWSFGHPIDEHANDGIVPTLSMLWGQLIWAGEADHLDILGHFHDDERPKIHVDWMTSGAHLTRNRFGQAMNAITQFLLAGSERSANVQSA
jgi:triacylglycerol esterase/lipase EstA (alpha/beta hydrolase family)